MPIKIEIPELKEKPKEGTEEPKEAVERFAKLAIYYSSNASLFLRQKEFQKAGEMMWGAMASILKAVAAKKGKKVEGHSQLFSLAAKLSKNLGDDTIYRSFLEASHLHKNFYESDITEEELRLLAKSIAKTVGKLVERLGYKAR